MTPRAIGAALLLASFAASPAFSKDEERAAEAPYANDLGPDAIDVSSYPAKHQKTYRTLLPKCAKCHSLSRPFNSEFLELGKKELKKLEESSPELFAEESLLKADGKIWNRYVKRMMAKPGCGIKSKEGRAIWEFLVYDSKTRKLGKNASKWRELRRGLLKEFKAKYPERYGEIYGGETGVETRPKLDAPGR